MNKKYILPALIALLLGALQNAYAEGELMVIPASLQLFNGHDKTVKLRNMGDSPLYLSISVQKVTNPGLVPEKKIPLGDVSHPGMIATPDKLTLGPNQSRNIRLTPLSEPGQEEVYRLYITPARSLQVTNAPQDKITAPMSVAIGYGVLVRHMPAPGKQQTGWTHKCENGQIELVNTGNVRLRMTNVKMSSQSKSTTIGLFPGTPQRFKSSVLSFTLNETPFTVNCP